MKFYSKIVRFTQDSLYFLTEEDCKFVFIFNDGAPEELADISCMTKLIPALEARGYSKAFLDGLFYENAVRFLTR